MKKVNESISAKFAICIFYVDFDVILSQFSDFSENGNIL